MVFDLELKQGLPFIMFVTFKLTDGNGAQRNCRRCNALFDITTQPYFSIAYRLFYFCNDLFVQKILLLTVLYYLSHNHYAYYLYLEIANVVNIMHNQFVFFFLEIHLTITTGSVETSMQNINLNIF